MRAILTGTPPIPASPVGVGHPATILPSSGVATGCGRLVEASQALQGLHGNLLGHEEVGNVRAPFPDRHTGKREASVGRGDRQDRDELSHGCTCGKLGKQG